MSYIDDGSRIGQLVSQREVPLTLREQFTANPRSALATLQKKIASFPVLETGLVVPEGTRNAEMNVGTIQYKEHVWDRTYSERQRTLPVHALVMPTGTQLTLKLSRESMKSFLIHCAHVRDNPSLQTDAHPLQNATPPLPEEKENRTILHTFLDTDWETLEETLVTTVQFSFTDSRDLQNPLVSPQYVVPPEVALPLLESLDKGQNPPPSVRAYQDTEPHYSSPSEQRTGQRRQQGRIRQPLSQGVTRFIETPSEIRPAKTDRPKSSRERKQKRNMGRSKGNKRNKK